MKKLFIACAVLLAGQSFAQSEPRFTIGSKFAFGHSYIMPHGGGGFNGSWAVGLTSMYMSGENIGFGADALYSAEGGALPLIDGTMADAEIYYFRVPLRLIYAMGESGSNFRPRISAGPTFGINMGEGTGYKDMDFGVNASAGFNYKMVEGLWLGVDAAYYHGLMDVEGTNTVSDRNGNIRLELSLTFGL